MSIRTHELPHTLASSEIDNRRPSWFWMGQPVSGAATAAEALEQAGLNWTAEKTSPLMSGSGKGFSKIDGRAFTRRSDTKEWLGGFVSDTYEPVQNVEAFGWLDRLLGNQCEIVAGGAIANGAKVFLVARALEEIVLDPDGVADRLTPHMLLLNHHDGRGAMAACENVMRFSCTNALNLALRSAARVWKVRHCKRVEDQMKEAETALTMGRKYVSEFAETATDLLQTTMSDNEFDEFINAVLNAPDRDAKSHLVERWDNRKDRLFDLFQGNTPTQERIGHTRWGALNAVIEEYDFLGEVKVDRDDPELAPGFLRARRQANSGLFHSEGETVKTKALRYLLAA